MKTLTTAIAALAAGAAVATVRCNWQRKAQSPTDGDLEEWSIQGRGR